MVEQTDLKCSRCPIHTPIDPSKLIRTHPLRSSQSQSPGKDLEPNSTEEQVTHIDDDAISPIQTQNSDGKGESSDNKINHHRHHGYRRDKRHCKHHGGHKHLCKLHLGSVSEVGDGDIHRTKTIDRTSSFNRTGENGVKKEKFRISNIFRLFCCEKNTFLLSTGLLIAGYALLLVVAVVVGVALSQGVRSRSNLRTQGKLAPLILHGAVPARGSGHRLGHQNINLGEVFTNSGRSINSFGSSRGRQTFNTNNVVGSTRSRDLISRGSTVNFRPIETTTTPITTTTTTTETPFFNDYDDYIYEDYLNYATDEFNLPVITPPPNRVTVNPLVTGQSRPRATSPSRAPTRTRTTQRFTESTPQRPETRRQTIPITFNTRFTLADTKGEDLPRGRKVPDVQIANSWSHRNEDGSYSWGYVNTDGSFKNETRGLDCVVRGAFGYPDKETGEILSFPYESGIPCDPDAPDYYVDDEGSVMLTGGQKAKINVVELAHRRKFI